MRLAPLALVLALGGCMMGQTYWTPPREAALLGEQEAVDVAADYARSRGMQVERTTSAELDGQARWHVQLAGPGAHAQVLVDAVSGRVLKASLTTTPPATAPPPAPPPTGPATRPAPAQAPAPAQDDWEE